MAALGGLTALGYLAACGGTAPSAGAPGGTNGLLAFGSQGNIFTMTLDGKTRRQVTKIPGGALARDPVWSPDGTHLLYAYSPPLPAVRGPGGLLPLPVTDLHLVQPDGSNDKPMLEHDAPGAGYESPVWSPDAKSVYVTYTALVMESNIVKDQTVEVARVPIGGGSRTTIAPNAMLPSGEMWGAVKPSNLPTGTMLLAFLPSASATMSAWPLSSLVA